ncbi:MAG TPA: type VI secretion system baseplate subunit TssK [Polyangia bacterium]|nr:type VI secretion system baseplate subunit TssK [Polyangia bacterium]
MKPPQRVVWSEGMLVSPQHLQQQDLYHERLLDERIAALAPYRWGVVAAEIDAGALGTDQLHVTKFVGILPDGLFVGVEGGDPECPPARPIGAHFPPTQPSCDVYLAVAKEREGVPSVSAEQLGTGGPATTKAARARFRAVSRGVADLTGNAADLAMAFALRNVVVLFGDEAREDFDAIKIAEVVRDGRGALIVNETYIPPTPRIDTSPFLMGRVRHVLSMLVTKQRQLAGDRRQRDGASIEFSAGDVTRFLQLSTVNTAIPLLTYAASNGEITPNQLYLLLVQVAGQLATFGDVDPSKLPLYQYTDLRATFEELFARVVNLLRTTVREAFMRVTMEVVDGIHLGKLDDDRLLAAPQYVLAVRSEIPEAQLAQRLPGLCKIAARTQLPQVIRAAATPGVPIQVTHRPPAEIPVQSGVTYFTLTLQNEFWRQIVEERLVAIYLPPPFGPQHVKLELLAVPKGG